MKTIFLSLTLMAAPPQAFAAEIACAPPAKSMARVELIFGLGSGKARVSERNWERFAAREISPRFPNGFSLLTGKGQWRNKAGHIEKESSRLLLIYYEASGEAYPKIEAIRQAYKIRFHQESVLRADGMSCVSF